MIPVMVAGLSVRYYSSRTYVKMCITTMMLTEDGDS